VFTEADHRFMARALELGERALYTTSPNPRVGAVVVRDGVVVGEGWHERPGEPHAEVHALRAAGARAAGATIYVTLEPCNHFGRTPPCVDAVIAAGVGRVVAAMRDPNALAAGGAERLRAAGIATDFGLMEQAARELNIGWVTRIARGRPWVRLKVAATLDGKTALANGRSQWITSPEARRDGHHWRARACAILTGIGTVKGDNPQLTVRDVPTLRQPLRVLVDSRLDVSDDAKILQGGNVLVFGASPDTARVERLRGRGIDVVTLPNPYDKVELKDLFAELGRRGMNEVHVEAGHKLNGSLIREGVVDELLVYFAPRLMGEGARGMFNLPELASLDEMRQLEIVDVTRVGPDLRVIARFR